MHTRYGFKLAVLAALIAGTGASPVAAAVFTGSVVTNGFAGPDASCAPLPFRGTVPTGAASSNLGSFDYTHNVCLAGVSGPVSGGFLFTFADGTLFGNLTGTNSFGGSPGLAILDWAYAITGGTGRFAGASGGFKGIGTSQAPPPVLITLQFDGEVFAPGVPEPASWAFMMTGFGVIGAAMRRSRTTSRSGHLKPTRCGESPA